MKVLIFVVFLISLSFWSCNLSNEKPQPPEEPCENISLWSMPIITYGFSTSNYDSVTIQLYDKNSKFEIMQEELTIELGKVTDSSRITRYLNLPETVTTESDFMIIFNDSLQYRITEMKTEWVERYGHSFIGYECTLVSYKINGELDDSESNICISEPSSNLNN